MPKGIYVRTEDHGRNISKAKKGKPNSEEQNNRISKSLEGKPKSDDHKKSLSEAKIGIKLGPMSEDHKNSISESLMGHLVTKETSEKISEAKIGKYCGENSYNWGMHHSKETIKLLSESKMGNRNPMFGRVGELNPAWSGGNSFLPYSPEFNDKLKNKIREKFNHTCVLCEEWANIPHHIDYDKTNNVEENFVLLCKSDNSRVNANRGFWETQFKILNGIYDSKFLGV
jgi:hypothetical protein